MIGLTVSSSLTDYTEQTVWFVAAIVAVLVVAVVCWQGCDMIQFGIVWHYGRVL